MNPRRARLVKKGSEKRGPVVYWMSRDQRADDNWALIFAQELAVPQKVPLVVAFCMTPSFLEATPTHYNFMLTGLREVAASLAEKNISFCLLKGEPGEEVLKFVKKIGAGVLVTDFDPLKIKLNWKDKVRREIDIPFYEVDARNIVPCFIASNKQEFGAYTLRPKIHRLLDEFVEKYPPLKKHPHSLKTATPNFQKIIKVNAGEKAARKMLKSFINNKLNSYPADKNNPAKDAVSNLSAYLHFGQISSLTIYNKVIKSDATRNAKQTYLEELVVRRELSDNYCYYNKDYDSFAGLPNWAKETLNKHRKYKRYIVYTLKELEAAKTHDELWNTSQIEMMNTGKMHGYMRMYWAKKILEWTNSPEEAIEFAIYLNNKYELDGRDSNGYTGIMWAIGGLHDRAWGERPIFGKIRYMSYNSQIKKIDLEGYKRQIKIFRARASSSI